MATKIRLKRIGRRNRPFYRIIIIDSRKRRDGSAIEQVGWYNPIESNKEKNYVLKEDRILEWLKLGAQVTDPVNKLMKRSGLAYRWHLMKQGLSEKEIDKAVEEWKKERDKVIQDRIKANKVKKEKLKAEKAAAKVAEETPEEEEAPEPSEDEVVTLTSSPVSASTYFTPTGTPFSYSTTTSCAFSGACSGVLHQRRILSILGVSAGSSISPPSAVLDHMFSS